MTRIMNRLSIAFYLTMSALQCFKQLVAFRLSIALYLAMNCKKVRKFA